MNDMYTTIYEKLTTVQWLMKRRQMFSQTQYGPFADSTQGQGRIIAMLKIQPEIATKDLAYLLGIRQQSLNELLNKLEKNGFIERSPSEEDKRVMFVRITEKGKTVEQPETDYKKILDCLSTEELQQFGEYLNRIIKALVEKCDEKDAKSINRVKGRMDEESFERLMAMRERAFGTFGRGRVPASVPSAERFPFEYDSPVSDRGGLGSFVRGEAPADVPGAERFSSDYDGPVPDRDNFGFFGDRPKK